MSLHPNDDLFEETKMSFGEHLEELRTSLFQALIGLVIGFVISLWLASYVVDFIQSPLQKALDRYYVDKAVAELKLKYDEDITPEMEAVIRKNQIVFDESYIEKGEFQRLLIATEGATPTHVIEEGEDKENDAAAAGDRQAADADDDATGPTSTDQSVGGPPELAEEDAASEGEEEGQAVEVPTIDVINTPLGPPSTDIVATRTWRRINIATKALSAHEVFMIWLQAAMIVGVILSSPWMFWKVWSFVAAGLYPHERRYVYIYLPMSLLLFLSGAALAFFFVFEPVLDFLFQFNRSMNIDPDPRISEWISFVLFLPLGFGVSFQLPLVMLFIQRIGIISIETYIDKWRIAVLVIFVLSMLLTPADPISMLLMAVPLTILYFGGIGLCKWMPQGRNPFDEAYEPTA